MSLRLTHVGMCLEEGFFIVRYPTSYVGGGDAVAWTCFIIVGGPISQLYTFIFDDHVVHDNTGVHYISNAVDMPQTRWSLNCSPSSLKHTKCALHVFSRRLLPRRKRDSSSIPNAYNLCCLAFPGTRADPRASAADSGNLWGRLTDVEVFVPHRKYRYRCSNALTIRINKSRLILKRRLKDRRRNRRQRGNRHGDADFDADFADADALTVDQICYTNLCFFPHHMLLVSVTVAANALSFSRFKRKNLSPFKSPIDEINGALRFYVGGLQTKVGKKIIEGIAVDHSSPAHGGEVEIWSDPDTELKLAKDTGVQVFRMGIDWMRIMPEEPVNGTTSTANFAALERYKWIINRVHSYGMKVMLTLFHHSLPPWAAEYRGWKLEKTVDYFLEFTRIVVSSVSDLVDYWVTFNEPRVFCMLTYCAGSWPGGNPDMLEAATSALPTGVFNVTMNWIAVAHSKAYDYIHEKSVSSTAIVGVAHHVSFMRPYGLFDIAAVSVANSLTMFPFMDSISDKMDYIGINYYGQEVVASAGLKLVETDEYSESGRGVYPDGLFRMLLRFHERYKHLGLPFIISENGVSDGTDLIRRPYMIEHLLATYAAMLLGVPVLGYLFWTISDNWEWADGYGPKFGLVAVDRMNNLVRIPRPSYHLFSKVVKSGVVTRLDRARAWNELQTAAREGKTRPFYRAVNKHGLMYAGNTIPLSLGLKPKTDWWFGHYEVEGLQDPLSRLSHYMLRPLHLTKKARPREEFDNLVVEPLTIEA
ncbi:hypothetical protein SASPL_112524 [Salvia splendens]|uniref:Beta-glucosidase n=1 Tax=Salvia splendens TaxID=180675 RepID=A0A8X8Y974_SALSN|nr:hypothetical protein SASPL_112524 [Salvia splendens]